MQPSQKSAAQKPDSKLVVSPSAALLGKPTSKAKKAPSQVNKATKTAAQRKDQREAMAKTQPMSAITDAMVAAHAAAHDGLHEFTNTRG